MSQYDNVRRRRLNNAGPIGFGEVMLLFIVLLLSALLGFRIADEIRYERARRRIDAAFRGAAKEADSALHRLEKDLHEDAYR